MNKIIMVSFLSAISTPLMAQVPSGYEKMAASLKPVLIGATDIVNRSVRVDRLDASDNKIDMTVVVGMIDTTKPLEGDNDLRLISFSRTKESIVASYCAPFGRGDLYFDTLKQRNVQLNYLIVARSEVAISSFSVSNNDCK
ncbi:hypothetical protein [Klebsiella huaxiensis]|uniref:Uncharacterized protein n=1 Tax=Klebsiella huaxiensis TaxID=2153354 RepID=A0A564M4R5_9ENTR|nr:hypothetical protein [Klebsiella huaxiensis]VUS88774.1 hypothetical protein SB6422_02764 [Klebsiella huaxiensis]